MVKKGQRILTGVNVEVTSIQQLLTPAPTVSDKDSEDIGEKLRYLIDQVELLVDEPHWVTSEKATHFTGAIAQNAKEDENLAGLAANKIVITDVMIEGEEDLAFYLLFFSTDGFDDGADLDLDTFLGFVDLDIPNNGFRIGAANQYYLSVTDINLHYEDEDATNELHVSLLCRTAAGKQAAAAGYVKVKIAYKVRE